MYKYIIIFLFILSNSLLGQKEQFDRATYYSYGIRLFSEAHILPDTSPDSINVLVLFKISNDALVFIQVNPLENIGSFQALPSVEIFFRDKNGIIRNRTLWSDTIYVKTYDDTKSKDTYVYGQITAKLPKSDYNCTVQLLDKYKKPADKNEFEVRSNLEFLTKSIISDPIFAFSDKSLPVYKSVPFVLGNKVNFTSSDAKILIPVSYSERHNVFNYIIKKVVNKEAKFWNDSINISGRAVPSDDGFLYLDNDKKHPYVLTLKTGFKYQEGFGKEIKVGVLTIELPSVRLSPGEYSLSVFADGKGDTSNFNFDVIWVDMPLALRNPTYAIEMMYYILSDEEFKAMESGSDALKAKKMMDYWKGKDPTNQTPYNEAMTEYFKRVDFAFFNFQTLKEKDGAKTDRGKIYILLGKPSISERTLNNGKQYEVWTYNDLQKVFHFELVANGLFVLTKIDENANK